jgi:hypothetical protein
MKTYKDFKTRSELVEYLNLYQPNSEIKDFVKLTNISVHNYVSELQQIKTDINEIQKTWNNQSLNQIEKSVATKGSKQLDIMQGQRTEKIQAGYHPDQPQYRINNCGANSYFKQFAENIGLKNSLARFHVQFPGEVTAWHTDIFSPSHEFLGNDSQDLEDELVGKDRGIRRVLIALEDWSIGQFFLFGKTMWSDWHAGDVVSWNYGVPHGTANMGYLPRISVSITGQISDKFTKLNEDARKL